MVPPYAKQCLHNPTQLMLIHWALASSYHYLQNSFQGSFPLTTSTGNNNYTTYLTFCKSHILHKSISLILLQTALR